MADLSDLVKTVFHFGSTTVQILQGDILAPGVDVDALVSSDDNYLTMGSGVSRLLADQGGRHYVHAAQAQSPVKVGTVVVTGAHQLAARMPSLKYVLHGAVIDYDTYDLPLEQSVYQTTMNCLEKAEELGVRGILFPALGSGAGGLTMEACARQMCGAIKSYLAHERPIKTILLMLFLPQAADGAPAPADTAQFAERNRGFIREANLVLGVPYNPASNILQTRDFYGRDTALQQIQAVLAGEKPGKRHALILGGPAIGKSALLDRLAYLAQQPANGQGRSVARVVFGRVHEGTPASFVYRKLLLCLRQGEEDAHVIREIKRLYAQSRLTCRQFLKFLQEHADHYPDVLFLIDNLPQLLLMGCDDLWRDLNELEARIRFAFTATADDQYQKLRDRLSDSFKAGLEEIPLRCVSEDERETWVNQLYQQYLDRDATGHEHDFIEEEAGQDKSAHVLEILQDANPFELAGMLKLSRVQQVAEQLAEVLHTIGSDIWYKSLEGQHTSGAIPAEQGSDDLGFRAKQGDPHVPWPIIRHPTIAYPIIVLHPGREGLRHKLRCVRFAAEEIST